jgi:anti-sigma factor RsiW
MNCKEVNKILISFLDGELNEAAQNSLQEHLNDCNECKKNLLQLEKIYSTIEIEKKEFSPNPYMAQKVWNKMQSSESTFKTPVVPMRRVTIITIAAAGVAFGVAIGSLLNSTIYNQPNNTNEQTWSQLADDYFPSDIYSPYEELNNNN